MKSLGSFFSKKKYLSENENQIKNKNQQMNHETKNCGIAIHPVSILIWIWLFCVLGFCDALGYIFAIVLHEFGHFLAAKKLGYLCQRFSLCPYGVSLDVFGRMQQRDEILIALAGPFANLLTAILCVSVWWVFPTTYFFTQSFVMISVLLALFNLLPAFPMDGGRVFVRISSTFVGEKIAKRIAFFVNIILGILFFIAFVVFCFINFNPTYFLFAFFLWAGALDLNFSSHFGKVDVFHKISKNFAKPCFFVVNLQTTVKQLLDKMETSKTCVFLLVLKNGKVVTISEQMVLKIILNFNLDCTLHEIFL